MSSVCFSPRTAIRWVLPRERCRGRSPGAVGICSRVFIRNQPKIPIPIYSALGRSHLRTRLRNKTSGSSHFDLWPLRVALFHLNTEIFNLEIIQSGNKWSSLTRFEAKNIDSSSMAWSIVVPPTCPSCSLSTQHTVPTGEAGNNRLNRRHLTAGHRLALYRSNYPFNSEVIRIGAGAPALPCRAVPLNVNN